MSRCSRPDYGQERQTAQHYVRIEFDHLARPIFDIPQFEDRFRSGVPKLFEIGALDLLELHLQNAWRRLFAILADTTIIFAQYSELPVGSDLDRRRERILRLAIALLSSGAYRGDFR